MFSRQKKLTLSTPYSKMTKILWQNKKINSQKQKENVVLKTRLHHLSKNKTIKERHTVTSGKFEEKYEKLIQKFKDQAKWIKETNEAIEERKYEELKEDIQRIESKLNRMTKKALNTEEKVRKSYSKMQKIESQEREMREHEINADKMNSLSLLEQQKDELQTLLEYKRGLYRQIEQGNKSLNKELIDLLNIKNALRLDLRQSKDTKPKQQRDSVSKPLVVTNFTETKISQ